MRKKIILSGLIITSSMTLASGTFANADYDREDEQTPAGYSEQSGSLDSHSGATPKHQLGDRSKMPQGQMLHLTDTEKTALASMTETERKAFFETKRNIVTLKNGSENTVHRGNIRTQEIQRNTTTNVQNTTSGTTIDRQTRIAENRAKQLEQKKQKIQKKLLAGESLTRLEKKFATANDISY